MSAIEVKGWCPGALRPMMSGDGLIVRVKPFAGRLSSAQAHGLAKAARDHGNGIIELSSRANLQLRGVTRETYPSLLLDLEQLGVLDPSPEVETRRNILVTPFSSGASNGGASAYALAAELEQRLATSDLALPGKFGFAVDCGPERVLDTAPADIRIERNVHGGLLVRGDGAELGLPVAPAEAAGTAVALAGWFVETGGVRDGRGRMSAHIQSGAGLPAVFAGSQSPVPTAAPARPGLIADGALVAVAFGSMSADTLDAVAGHAQELRLTPWRMIFLPRAEHLPASSDIIVSDGDPVLRVEACPGAPRCPQAMSETRGLALKLASIVPAGRSLHVSGCAKGCARARPATVTIVATADGYDLIRNGTAQDRPLLSGVAGDQLADKSASLLGAD